ncbi:hypothetical protein [Nonomuraea glycinis]|uniref:hypothetical protein n=1 Tax=Nonomuraea glycinis TaxID=2047744 RepID=UPI00339DC1FC
MSSTSRVPLNASAAALPGARLLQDQAARQRRMRITRLREFTHGRQAGGQVDRYLGL